MTNPQTQHKDSVKVWLPRLEHLEAGMAMVDYYLHHNHINEAHQALNNLTAVYQMSPNQQVEVNHFRNLKNIQISLAQQGQCVFDLAPSQIQGIVAIAENSKGIAGQQAKNILNYGFGYDIFDPTIYPELSGPQRVVGAEIKKPENSIVAFPNPANEELSFQYQLDRVYADLAIKIYNVRGQLQHSIQLPDGHEGFVSWQANNLIPGIYLYSITSYDHALHTGKLVIVE
jgi:Secretion system C-terminal sorting domain